MDYYGHHQGGGGLFAGAAVHVPPPPPPPGRGLFAGAAQAERPRSPARGQQSHGRDSGHQEDKRSFGPDPSESVYMVGLPLESDEESIKSVFSEYGGTVHSVKLLPIKDGANCAAALVRMGTTQQAKYLVDNVHGEIPKGYDHVVTIRFANAKGKGKGKDEWGPPRTHITLNVSGCASPEVSDIIQGKYQVTEQNHNKNVYRKEGEASTVVLIYYWDDRDGPDFHGWWFGPKIGGDQVWAYNEEKGSPNPPGQGWRVPWNGGKDASLKVTIAPGSGAQALFYSMQSNPYADWAAGNSSANPVRVDKDDMIKQKMAALKEKRQQEETMRQEQAAALVVRKVIQKLRMATPDMFDEVRRELDIVQSENMETMGAQAEKVMQEAEKAIAQFQEKVDEQNMKKMAEEQKRLEEELKEKQESFRIENTTKEATEEVVQAEAQVAQATALGVPVTEKEAEDDLTAEGIFEAVQIVEEALVGAQATMDKASASLILQKAELGVTTQAVDALKSGFKPLFMRLAECRRASATLSKRVRAAKEKATAREKAEQERKAAAAAAAKKEEEQKAAFAKFDADGDGKLNKDEIVAFAKAEYELTPTDDHVEKWMSGFDGEGGVAYGNFARLRSVVSIAKSEAKAREKRMEEEAKGKEIADKRAALGQKVSDLHASVTEADGLVAKAVASAAALASQGESERLLEAIAETEASAQEPGEEAARILSRAEELEGEDTSTSELAPGFVKKEMFKVRSRITALRGKLEKVAADVVVAKQRADELEEGRLEQLRVETVVCIRDFMDEVKKTEQQLFEEVCAGAEDVPADKLASFVSSLPSAPKFKDGEAIEMFQHVLKTEGCSAIGKDAFHKFIRLFYQVVRDTVITDSLSIQGKVIRRLEVGEILERTHGAEQEETVKVKRMQCRSSKDGKTHAGWVTVSGNQGSAFLKPVSPLLEAAKQMASLLSEAGGV